MDIIQEGKLSVLRRYFFESVIVALAVCVATLFYMYVDVTNYIRSTLTDQVISNKIVIQENIKAIDEMKTVIRESKK